MVVLQKRIFIYQCMTPCLECFENKHAHRECLQTIERLSLRASSSNPHFFDTALPTRVTFTMYRSPGRSRDIKIRRRRTRRRIAASSI